jgi:3-hydroxyisobutyrate dehydrogenase-like beta-hydroxyacid dehydrogenase
MAGTNGRGEDLPVAVPGTGIMGSEIARNWSPRACAQRSGTGQHRSRRCCRTLARWRRAQRPRRSRMRGVVITMLPTAEAVQAVIFDGEVAGRSPAVPCGPRWAPSASR